MKRRRTFPSGAEACRERQKAVRRKAGGSRSALEHETAHGNAEHYAHEGAVHHERRAAVADEGQRHAHHGHESHHHADVHDDLPEEVEEYACGQRGAEAVLGVAHGAVHGHEEQAEQRDEGHASGKAPFLAEHGYGEVGMLFRQKAQLTLRARKKALAEHLARADGYLRLDDVIARAPGIARGIEKREYALLLIVVQHEPSEGHDERNDHEADAQDLPLHAVKEHHAAEQHQHGEAGAEVGLLGDEEKGHHAYGEHLSEPFPAQRFAVAAEGLGAHHEHGELGEFARLKIHDAEVYPALGAVHGLAHDGNQHEQNKNDDIARHRQTLDAPVVDEHARHHDGKPYEPPHELPLVERRQHEAALYAGAACGVQIHHAHGEQQYGDEDKPPVDLEEHSSVGHLHGEPRQKRRNPPAQGKKCGPHAGGRQPLGRRSAPVREDGPEPHEHRYFSEAISCKNTNQIGRCLIHHTCLRHKSNGNCNKDR